MLDHLLENNVRSGATEEVGEGKSWTARLHWKLVCGHSAIYWWKTVLYLNTQKTATFAVLTLYLWLLLFYFHIRPKNTIPNVPLSSPGLLSATEWNSALSQALLSQHKSGCKFPSCSLSLTVAQCQIVLGCGQRRKIFDLRGTSIQESFIPSRFFQPQISTNISRGNIR